jgi:hypothetical protein
MGSGLCKKPVSAFKNKNDVFFEGAYVSKEFVHRLSLVEQSMYLSAPCCPWVNTIHSQ